MSLVAGVLRKTTARRNWLWFDLTGDMLRVFFKQELGNVSRQCAYHFDSEESAAAAAAAATAAAAADTAAAIAISPAAAMLLINCHAQP